jgi:uncharacterized protein
MQESKVINEASHFVRSVLLSDCTGHDWHHIKRVWEMAIFISQHEGGNRLIIELAALLHDIEDWKLLQSNCGDSYHGKVRCWLTSQGLDKTTVDRICKIIHDLSFKGANVNEPSLCLEGQIVQDADRLDAMGAIGIARTFAYGACIKRSMHNPDMNPIMHNSFEKYKKSEGTTINHFYEKLLLLKDRINTKSAMDIAKKRHDFMEKYLNEFLNEWR